MSLQTIDVSQARKELSSLMEAVYFEKQNFVLARRGIPMVRLVPVDKLEGKKTSKKKIDTPLFGIWKSDKKSTPFLAKKLREKAWER